MKITRKLVTSIVCLALSLAFCVWAVFAWFSANSRADANGMQVSVDKPNLTLAVNTYSLTASSTGDGTITYTKGSAINQMPQYGLSDTSAVLLEITVTNSSTEKDYTSEALYLTVLCNTTVFRFESVETDGVVTSFNSDLSNGISLHYADDAGADTFTKRGEGTFLKIEGDTTTKFNMSLPRVAIGAADPEQNVASVTCYYIMDYSQSLLSYLYEEAASYAGSVSASINFSSDMTFVLRETDDYQDTTTIS